MECSIERLRGFQQGHKNLFGLSKISPLPPVTPPSAGLKGGPHSWRSCHFSMTMISPVSLLQSGKKPGTKQRLQWRSTPFSWVTIKIHLIMPSALYVSAAQTAVQATGSFIFTHSLIHAPIWISFPLLPNQPNPSTVCFGVFGSSFCAWSLASLGRRYTPVSCPSDCCVLSYTPFTEDLDVISLILVALSKMSFRHFLLVFLSKNNNNNNLLSFFEVHVIRQLPLSFESFTSLLLTLPYSMKILDSSLLSLYHYFISLCLVTSASTKIINVNTFFSEFFFNILTSNIIFLYYISAKRYHGHMP